METAEKIPVFLKIVNGKTVCVCHASAKGCKQRCERDVVTRDKFEDWKSIMRRDSYGR